MRASGSAQSGSVKVQGGHLPFETLGEGHPLLLLHADVADRRMWDEQVGAFAKHYRVIRIDKRGFGAAESDDGPYSPRQDIVDVLSSLGITHTAILGLSNGGATALDFALEHPKMVDALIVAAGGVSGSPPAATAEEMVLIGHFQALQERQDVAGLVELGVRVWADGPNQPVGRAAAPVRERLRAMLADNYRLHHEQLQPCALEPPASGRLGELDVPTLVMIGDLDFSGTISAMDQLANGVTGAQHVVFAGAAHMLNMEQPGRFNAVVLAFLREVLS